MVWFFDRLRNGELGRRCFEEFWIGDWRFWIRGAFARPMGVKFKVPSSKFPDCRFRPVLPGLIFTGAGVRSPVPNQKGGGKVNLELHARSQGWSRSVKPSQTYFYGWKP